MLKGISPLLPPELLKILMEMGHGDTLVLGDANFPAAANAKRLVRCDGHSGCALLEAVLRLLPLDGVQSNPVSVMATQDGSKPEIWDDYAQLIQRYEKALPLREVERYAFYEEAQRAYAIVSTGEGRLYANLILKKGVIASV